MDERRHLKVWVERREIELVNHHSVVEGVDFGLQDGQKLFCLEVLNYLILRSLKEISWELEDFGQLQQYLVGLRIHQVDLLRLFVILLSLLQTQLYKQIYYVTTTIKTSSCWIEE